MRAFLVAAVSLVLGASSGMGISLARYGSSTSADALRAPASSDESPPTAFSSAAVAKVSVDQDEFDFGAVENGSSLSHKFRITNVGSAPLTLNAGGTTCQKCTIAEISKDTLAPGDTVEVDVQYHAAGSTPKFRQSATILTNDPQRPRVELSVTGSITSIFELKPQQLVFSKLSVHEARTLGARLLNHITDSVNVVRHEWSDRTTEKFVEVQFMPLDAKALQEEGAKSGQLVSVTIQPGLPLGTFRQRLKLITDLPDNRAVELEVSATITSDISFVGGGWKDEEGFLRIGSVTREDGARRTVLVLIHGPFRDDVQLTVGEILPSFLKVTIGEKSTINNGAVVQYPLTIEIPPGSPSVNHLGSKLGNLARVTLETTHPDARQVRLPVRFAVED